MATSINGGNNHSAHNTLYSVKHISRSPNTICNSKICFECFEDLLEQINPACEYCQEKFTKETFLQILDENDKQTHFAGLISRWSFDTIFYKDKQRFWLVCISFTFLKIDSLKILSIKNER